MQHRYRRPLNQGNIHQRFHHGFGVASARVSQKNFFDHSVLLGLRSMAEWIVGIVGIECLSRVRRILGLSGYLKSQRESDVMLRRRVKAAHISEH